MRNIWIYCILFLATLHASQFEPKPRKLFPLSYYDFYNPLADLVEDENEENNDLSASVNPFPF